MESYVSRSTDLCVLRTTSLRLSSCDQGLGCAGRRSIGSGLCGWDQSGGIGRVRVPHSFFNFSDANVPL